MVSQTTLKKDEAILSSGLGTSVPCMGWLHQAQIHTSIGMNAEDGRVLWLRDSKLKVLGEMHSIEAGFSNGKTDNAKYVQKISQ